MRYISNGALPIHAAYTSWLATHYWAVASGGGGGGDQKIPKSGALPPGPQTAFCAPPPQ
jgi:hypothetical protein